jgi:hypothetical protein
MGKGVKERNEGKERNRGRERRLFYLESRERRQRKMKGN